MTTPASLEREYTLATAVARYDELRMQDLVAPGAEDLPADEQPEPGPLSRQEALELLALSEVIARKAAYGRQLTVRSARAAGASWTQIGVPWAPPSNPRGRPTPGGSISRQASAVRTATRAWIASRPHPPAH